MAKTVSNLEISMGEVRESMALVVRFKGLKSFRFRNWLGLAIMRVGAKVVGIEMEIEVGPRIDGPEMIRQINDAIADGHGLRTNYGAGWRRAGGEK